MKYRNLCISGVYSKIPNALISEKNKSSLEHLQEIPNESNEKITQQFGGETIIPVMTGKTGLPQICWGHAKYAMIPTEKNINILKIDHLE